jgi:hypothetical protein
MIGVGVASEKLLHAMILALWNEERQAPDPFKTTTSGEFALSAIKNTGPFLPTIGGLINYTIEAVKPGGGVLGTGFNLLPFTLANSTLGMVRSIVATGDPVMPSLEFIRQWFPNSRAIINRLDVREGLTEYYNVNRNLRALTPMDIETRRPEPQGIGGGGGRTQTAVSDNINRIINELMSANPDMGFVMQQRAEAVEEKRKAGNKDPEAAVDASVMARSPWGVVYGRKLTEDERGRVLARFNPDQLARLNKVESGFVNYANQVGRSEPTFVKAEPGTTGAGGGGSTGGGGGTGPRFLRYRTTTRSRRQSLLRGLRSGKARTSRLASLRRRRTSLA